MSEQALSLVGSRRRSRTGLLLLGALLLVSLLLALGIGAVQIGPWEIVSILTKPVLRFFQLPALAQVDEQLDVILWTVRLPRVLLAVLVGGGLALSGAVLQGLFRNPLADPALLGVTNGAGLAAAGTIVFGGSLAALLPPMLGPWLLPGAAFLGALAVTALVYGMAQRRAGMDLATLLLAGIAINSLAGAGLGLLTFVGDERQVRDISFWMLGSLAEAPWEKLLPVAVLISGALAILLCLARPLNALLLGEAEAFHLGFSVERVKRWLVVLVALASGAAVALTGTIAFVGLVVPHLARLLVGTDHRRLLPAAALLGASLLLLADLAARLVVLPAELPIGVVTSFVGAPVFLWLLRRRGEI